MYYLYFCAFSLTIRQVHFNSPMSPLELEIYHQIKNVIGVNPTFYEYLFMVDADTTVHPFALNRLVSAYVVSNLTKIICRVYILTYC